MTLLKKTIPVKPSNSAGFTLKNSIDVSAVTAAFDEHFDLLNANGLLLIKISIFLAMDLFCLLLAQELFR